MDITPDHPILKAVSATFQRLNWFFKELHYQRVLSIELEAVGSSVFPEAPLTSFYVDTKGRTHIIGYDRADILGVVDGLGYLIEIKRTTTVKPTLVEDTKHQIERYLHNASFSAPVRISVAFAVFFTPTECRVYKYHNKELILITIIPGKGHGAHLGPTRK